VRNYQEWKSGSIDIILKTSNHQGIPEKEFATLNAPKAIISNDSLPQASNYGMYVLWDTYGCL
jgi:hypothetical protein